MKLIYCEYCHDVFKLALEPRRCRCGETWGKYLPNGLDAQYAGDGAIPLGFGNTSLMFAIANRPEEGMGKAFTAFVIPVECPTMTHLMEIPDGD